MHIRSMVRLWLAASLCAAVQTAAAAEEAAADHVSYYRDVRPIVQAHCHGCHQPAKPEGEYVMTSVERLRRGGESGSPAVVPGKPDASYLVEQITPTDGEAEMPKGKKPLGKDQIETIRRWIAQGAEDDTPAAASVAFDAEHPPTYTARPIITALDFSPDGKLLAISGFHEVLLFRADGSERVARLIGISERIESCRFSPDGKRLAVTGGLPARMGEVQVWDVAAGTLQLSVPVTYDTVYGASWSPDGRYVAFGCADDSVRAIDAETGKQVLLQRAPNDWTLDTTFSVDGKHIVSVGRDMTVKLIEFATQRFVDNITSITPGALKGGLFAVARHPLRDEVAVGGDDGVPKTYRMFRKTARRIGDDSNLLRKFPPIPGRVFDVAYGPEGKTLAAASSLNGKGHVYLYACQYDLEIPKEIAAIESKTVGERSAAQRKKLDEYHQQGVRLVAKMAGQQGSVYAMAIRPDGQVIASGGYDGLVRLNEAASGRLIREFVPVSVEPSPSQTAGQAREDTPEAVAR